MAAGESFAEAIPVTPGTPLTIETTTLKAMYFRVETDKSFYHEAYTLNSALDMFMTIYDEFENRLLTDDDSGGNGQPYIEFEPVTGVTYIRLNDWNNRVLTYVELYINKLAKEVPPQPTFDNATLIKTETVTEQVLPGHVSKQYFRFLTEVGKTYVIQALGNEGTNITLYDSSRSEMAHDDGGVGYNARIKFTATTDEMFAFVALWSAVSYDVSITLSLKESIGWTPDPYPLPDGEPVLCKRVVVPIRISSIAGTPS